MEIRAVAKDLVVICGDRPFQKYLNISNLCVNKRKFYDFQFLA